MRMMAADLVMMITSSCLQTANHAVRATTETTIAMLRVLGSTTNQTAVEIWRSEDSKPYNRNPRSEYPTLKTGRLASVSWAAKNTVRVDSAPSSEARKKP